MAVFNEQWFVRYQDEGKTTRLASPEEVNKDHY